MYLGKRLKILFIAALLYGLWLIGPWQPTAEEKERDAKLQAKRDAEKLAIDTYLPYVNEIQESFKAEILNDMNLVCVGQRSSFHEKVEEISLDFFAYRRATIEEARALQLYLMNKLADRVNAHDEIQPFLKERPVTYKSIEIGISFKSPHGLYSDGTVGYIFNVPDVYWGKENRNRLHYRSVDPLTGNLIHLFQEPYEEAAKLVQASPITNLKAHKTTPQEEAFDEVIYMFAKEMESKYGFECWNIGGRINDYLEEIGVNFVFVHRAMQEEAKEFLILATETLRRFVNENVKIRPFLKEFPFLSDRIKMTIEFTKRNHVPYYDESIEKVGLEGNEIIYYKDEPHSPERKSYPLHTPVFAKESYQKALENP